MENRDTRCLRLRRFLLTRMKTFASIAEQSYTNLVVVGY